MNKSVSAALIMGALASASIAIDSGGALQPGIIYAANEARITSSTFSEALTAYSVGFKDSENLEAALNFLAPAIPVGRRFEFKKHKNFEQFLADVDDVRSIGSAFKRIELSSDTVNEKTLNKGLMYRIDKDDDLVSEEQVVAILKTRLLRSELKRGYALASAAATLTAKTWDSTSQPMEHMRAAVAAHQAGLGLYPNRGIIAQASWNKAKAAYAAQQNAGSQAFYLMGPDAVATELGLDGVRLERSLFATSTTTKGALLTTSTVLFFYGQDGILKDDASSLKRFYTPTEGGMFRVTRKEEGKFIDIIVEHYSNVVATVGSLQGLTVS